MLIGIYVSSISPKRRVAIPKKFRDELGINPILAKWYEGCLVLVSKENWNALLKRLTGRELVITQAVRDTDRFILGSAFELEPDNQGRIIIPANISGYAELTKEVVFLGLGDRVEIWNRDAWEKREELVAKQASGLIEGIAKKHE